MPSIKDYLKQVRIHEAYEPTNTGFIQNFIEDLRTEPIQAVSIAYGVDIDIIDTDLAIFNAGYHTGRKKIIFYISSMFLDLIRTTAIPEFKKQLVAADVGIYTHEDTHRQQHTKYNQLYKNYIPLKHYDMDNVKTMLKDAPYFCQPIEADAYGRQVAADIKTYYPNMSVDEIFKLIQEGNLNTGAQFFIEIYKDPLIPQKYRKKFFRAFYDELMV